MPCATATIEAPSGDETSNGDDGGIVRGELPIMDIWNNLTTTQKAMAGAGVAAGAGFMLMSVGDGDRRPVYRNRTVEKGNAGRRGGR